MTTLVGTQEAVAQCEPTASEAEAGAIEEADGL